MNKLEQENKKREVLNKLRYTSLSGTKEGSFYAYASESESHMDKKYAVWKKLKKLGYKIWCEPIFEKTNSRPDILAFRDGYWNNIEILESETTQELQQKLEKYPVELHTVVIKTKKDIDNLEDDLI